MNDSGMVVGVSSESRDNTLPVTPFVWRDGVFRVMDYNPHMSAWARAVDARGTIAGPLGTSEGWTLTLWDSTGVRSQSTVLPRDSVWQTDVVKLLESGGVLIWWEPDPFKTRAAVVANGAITWIGHLTDITWTVPRDMNLRGQVVGRSAWSHREECHGTTDSHECVSHHPFLWDNGGMRDLGVFGRTTGCWSPTLCATGEALAINTNGEIVGYAEDSNLVKRPFVWRDSVLTDLGVFPGKNAVARAINARGQIAGDGDDGAFLWDQGAIRMLGSLGGGYTEVTSMNEAGDIAGTSLTVTGQQHAFIVTGGRMIDLGLFVPGACGSMATTLNNRGDVLVAIAMPHNGECIYRLDDPRLLRFPSGRSQRTVVWHNPDR